MKIYRPLALFLYTTLAMSFWACDEDETVKPVNKLHADAGPDIQATINEVVTLDATNSSDGNEKPFSFQWTLKTRPDNSAATLSEDATATPKFTPDTEGLYIIELTIRQDNFFKTDRVSVIAKAASNAPVAHELRENITSETTLGDIFEDPAKADYIVTRDLSVAAKLTVAPGVVIEFEENTGLQILPQGILVAKGTSDEHIYFTGKVRRKGYWKGIVFQSSDPANELDHVNVDYAGSNPLPDMGMIKANVALEGGSFSGSAVKISNSSFNASGGYGLYVSGGSQLPYFSANYFNDNIASSIYVPAAQLHNVDFFSHYTGGNGFDGVETGGTLKADSEVAWSYFNDGSKYLVTQDLIVESAVRIGEGAIFEFAKNVMLKVTATGNLDASGSSFKSIVFTAHQKTADNFWKGIFIGSNNPNKLIYSIISHAGYSQMPDMHYKANVAVAPSAKLLVENSTLEKGLGWGVVAEEGSQVNQDIATVNFYDNFVDGYYKLPFSEPETTTLSGQWVDQWSFQNDHLTIAADFYHATSNTWFGGASDPWHMSPASGFGINIHEDGSYVWTIAQYAPWTGECSAYSAEYISGHLQSTATEITFEEDYWRSKFYTSCDPDQNVDTDVQPGRMTLRYQINKVYNMFTGADYWELKIINPDDSFFTYYRK